MEENSLEDYGKQIFDKIPDIAFDWYARLIPGIICVSLLVLVNYINLAFISSNLAITVLIAYLIGHIIQPFSSGILQKKYPKLKGKKGPLLSKAYSELIGFFSCLLFTFLLLCYKITNQTILNESYSIENYIILGFSLILFLFAVDLRKKAYYRKHLGQYSEKSKKSKKSNKKSA